MTLVEKLGQIAVPDKGRWYELKHEPKVIRQILLAVAEEIEARIDKTWLKMLEEDNIAPDEIEMPNTERHQIVQLLRAEAKKLEEK